MAPGESTVELPGGEAAPAASFVSEGEDDLQVEVDEDDDAGNFDDDDGDDEAGYF
jgi:hypothetical protein